MESSQNGNTATEPSMINQEQKKLEQSKEINVIGKTLLSPFEQFLATTRDDL